MTNTRCDYTDDNCIIFNSGTSASEGIRMYVYDMFSACAETGYIICRLNQTVNVTNFNYLKAKSCVDGSHAYITIHIGLSTNSNLTSASLTSSTSNYYDAGTLKDGNTETKTATLSSNISNVTGNYYIYFILQIKRNTTFSGNDGNVLFKYVKLSNE